MPLKHQVLPPLSADATPKIGSCKRFALILVRIKMKKMQCCSPTFASVATVIGRVEDYFLQAHHHGCRGQDLLVCAEGEKVVHVDSEGIVWCRIHAQLDHLSDDVPYVHFC